MWKQSMDIDLGHKAQNGTCYFHKTSLSDVFPAKDKAYSHSVAGSKQNPNIPGWKEGRGRGQWELCKARSLLLCPLIHLPACQETACLTCREASKSLLGWAGSFVRFQYQWVGPTWDSYPEFSWLDRWDSAPICVSLWWFIYWTRVTEKPSIITSPLLLWVLCKCLTKRGIQ